MTQTKALTLGNRIFQKQVAPIVQKAKKLVVRTVADREEAAEYAKQLKDMKAKLEEKLHLARNTEKAHELWQDNLVTRRAVYDPIDEAYEVLRGTIKKFDLQHSKKVVKKAEIQDAKRQETVIKEQTNLLTQAAGKEKKNPVQSETLVEQAQRASAAPVFTPPPVAVKPLVWKARISNAKLACDSIGKGLAPANLVEFKPSALNDFGVGHDGQRVVPGIEFYQDVSGRI